MTAQAPEPMKQLFEVDESKLGDSEYRDWLKSWNVQLPDEEVVEPVLPTLPGTPTEGGFVIDPRKLPGQTADEDDDEDTGPDSPDDDYNEWDKPDLQEELGKRELSKSGNMKQLIARLREDDAAERAQNSDDDETQE